MLQQHTFDASGSKIAIVPVTEKWLRFDSSQVVKAIVFHMVDEQIATEVLPDTVKRTMDRLKSKSFEVSIAREEWAVMSNSSRLQWLLDQTDTAFLIGDDERVSLRQRRGQR